MITLNKIIYNIRNIIKEKNDDSKITNSQLEFIFNNWRARLITQNYRKARNSDVNLTQDLGCIDMVSVDKAEDCEVTIGCTILRTAQKLPVPIELDEKPLLTFIGSIEKTGPQYQLIPWARFSWIKYQKWAGSMPYASIKDGYLYIINKKILDKINVQGIFQDPREAARFKHCSGEPCYTEDSNYPIDAGMIPLITELMFTKELAIYERSKEDLTNDNNDVNQKV